MQKLKSCFYLPRLVNAFDIKCKYPSADAFPSAGMGDAAHTYTEGV